jgi:hypothetical protein
MIEINLIKVATLEKDSIVIKQEIRLWLDHNLLEVR